jgi:phosphoglycerate dehydrogenase-like enzyme
MAQINVLIASPLEPELVARIAAVDPRLAVTYRPDLLGTPRYPADHFPPISRTPAQAQEWARLLAEAEVMFDVDQPSMSDFVGRAPNVRWIQASSSGIGEWVRRLGIVDSQIVATNAAGIHARPLAEFAIFAMLYFAKSWPRMAAEQRARQWERCAIDTLENKTLGIVGLGSVGRTVARLAEAFGMRILGVRRTPTKREDDMPGVGAVYGPDGLIEVLRQSQYLVLSTPHTSETVGLIGRNELACLPRGAVLINIARGSVIDEGALIESLQEGQLGGAALDVVAREPLAPESPLWSMPDVLITPHSMSTALNENDLLTELFCDNLRRYVAGLPLRNVIDKQRGY